jgi:uncharacterized membrane protein
MDIAISPLTSIIRLMSFGQIAFAVGMIASGLLNLANGNFYSPWDPIPKWIPAHPAMAYAYGVIMVLGGVGLLIKQTAVLSARVLLAALLVFLVLCKTPVLLMNAQIEATWLDYGEIATLVAGALALAATNDTQLRVARFLLGAAILPIGISHFAYMKIAEPMVPAKLPYHGAWVAFTGVAHIAAGVAILSGILAKLAAQLEAGMLTAFGVLVWLPAIFEKPSDVSRWIPFVVTIAVANSVWPVASTISEAEPLLAGGPKPNTRRATL